MTEITLIPLADIDPAALPRDRSGLDPEPLAELKSSIAASGLRMPIEVFASEGDPPFGLLSGYRRHWAFSELHEETGDPRYAAIPAIVRPATDLPQALAAMVEENEIRAPISPWEQGRIAVLSCRQEVFATVDEAIENLFPTADRFKRRRIRAVANVFESLDGWLTEPERLNTNRLLRIESALRAGFEPVFRAALEEASATDPDNQWRLMEPILAEAERLPADYKPPSPGRPRRVLKPRYGLTLRREETRDGWAIHFTGPEATSDYMDVVFREFELRFTPEKPKAPSPHRPWTER